MHIPTRTTLIILLAAVLAGCGDAIGPEDVASVTLSPASDTIQVGGTVKLTATLTGKDGKPITTLKINWSSSSNSIASVDTTGLVTGVGPGSATITASVNGASGQAEILVAGPAPTISSVSPGTGTVGTELKIIGTNFRSGITVRVGALAADSVDRTADTLVFALVPTGVTANVAVGVTVNNNDGTSATLSGAFTAVAPELDYVNSATKPSGQVNSTVILEGNAFGDLKGSGKVLFSDGAGGTIEAAIANEDDWTNTFIVTTVPSGTKTGDLKVTTATGTSNALTFTVTEAAVFSPSVINWQATADLPTAVSGHRALFVPIDDAMGNTIRHVHVTGGASNDQSPRQDVIFGVINADGTISAWNTTVGLPEARAFHALAAATPFNSKIQGAGALYAIGGIKDKDGPPVSTVYRGTLNTDGTVASWAATTALPVALHSAGAVVFRGSVYVAGGAGADSLPVATVYRAVIDTLGELGAWELLPALPAGRTYYAFATFGGFLYAVGGESGKVTPNNANYTQNDSKYDDLVYVRINLRTGALAATSWTVNASTLIKRTSKHSGVIAGGNVFVTGGLYSGANTGATENSFAQVNADGSVGSFGGATGGNTINGSPNNGGNLFNHAAVTYVDANGTAHVMVLGGDDVNNPGSKRKAVWFY